MILWGLIAVLIIALDQITKYLVINNIGPNDTVTVIKNVFEFVYVKNTGGSIQYIKQCHMALVDCIDNILYRRGCLFYKGKAERKKYLSGTEHDVCGCVG